jgi:acetyltransferase-like isoleucine patch superfamily enzyme
MASARSIRLRPLVRDALVYVGVGLLWPLWLPALVARRSGRGDGWFAGSAELLSAVPGKLGVFLRRSFYRMTLDRCATETHVGFGSLFAHPGAEMHSGAYVGLRCTIGMVVLETDVTVGSNVDILSGRRQHGTGRVDIPIQDQPGQFSQVRIGRNSWIGNSSVVMADVGRECVVGAGSVVVRPVPDGTVAVGNPAAVVKARAA